MKLGEIASVVSGGTPSSSVPAFWDGGIPWCTPTDITSQPGRYLTKTERTISEAGLANSAATLLPPGALLLCSRATIGEVKLAQFPVATNQGFKSLVCSKDADPHFMYYLVLSVKSSLQSKGVGSTFLEVSKQDVESLELCIPKIEEQRAIAEVLSDADDLIDSLDALIEKKENVKTAAMQQLLTDSTPPHSIPDGWRTVKLGDVCAVVSGGTPSSSVPAFWDGGIRWCTPTDITSQPGRYLTNTERTISEAGLANSAATLLPPGALLLCSRATIGEVKLAQFPVATNQGFKSLVCGNGTDPQFMYYLVLSVKSSLQSRGVGSTFLEVSKQDVESLEVCIPKIEEQRAIAEVLSDMDTEIDALKERRAKMVDVKRAMMQDLLTGKVRLV